MKILKIPNDTKKMLAIEKQKLKEAKQKIVIAKKTANIALDVLNLNKLDETGASSLCGILQLVSQKLKRFDSPEWKEEIENPIIEKTNDFINLKKIYISNYVEACVSNSITIEEFLESNKKYKFSTHGQNNFFHGTIDSRNDICTMENSNRMRETLYIPYKIFSSFQICGILSSIEDVYKKFNLEGISSYKLIGASELYNSKMLSLTAIHPTENKVCYLLVE